MKNLLLSSLRTHQYAVLQISPHLKRILDSSIADFTSDCKFRFPPILPEPIPLTQWPKLHQESYVQLLNIAVDVFGSICEETRANNIPYEILMSADNEWKTREHRNERHLDYFNSTFMNIFNYNYGYLGVHKDRCLVTVIYTKRNPLQKKSLHVRRSHHKTSSTSSSVVVEGESSAWLDLDATTSADSVAIFVGEEMQQLTQGRYRAITHCVCEDPKNPLENSGCSSLELNERRSIALVLSSDCITRALNCSNVNNEIAALS
jgi:hypothetical protein